VIYSSARITSDLLLDDLGMPSGGPARGSGKARRPRKTAAAI